MMEDVLIRYRIKFLKGVSEGVIKTYELTVDNLQDEGLIAFLWRTSSLEDKNDASQIIVLERKYIPVF